MTSHSPDPTVDPVPGGATSKTSGVLRAAVDLFVLAPAHERAEIRAFADLLDGLMPDAGVADRAHVARQLARRADTPLPIARALAMDVAEVAAPMVLSSPVLTSADLVQIMRRSPEHVALVAERLDLAPDVVMALGRSIDAEANLPPARSIAPSSPAQEAEMEEDVAMSIEAIVSEAARARPLFDSETQSELALQRALDELAAEMAAEADAHEAEEAAAKALRDAMPVVAGDIDVFLSRDPAGRWRYIQEFGTAAQLGAPPPRRRRGDDPAVVGAKLFGTLVAGDRDRLAVELMEATRLDRPIVDRILTDRHGEALAVTLAALGIDERTATSILLLHTGERATLAHMQDLSAMAGHIGWRTAEQILASWRGTAGSGRGGATRVLDPADRRPTGARESAAGEANRSTGTAQRRVGGEG